MATVVSVTDAWTWGSRTDNIVVDRPEARQLLWVPRDLWIAETNNRNGTGEDSSDLGRIRRQRISDGTGAPEDSPQAHPPTGPRSEALGPLASEARDFFPALRTGGPRRLPIAYIVVHSMEVAGPDAAASAGRWFRDPDGIGSAHLGVDDQSTQRYLEDDMVARGAQPINESSLHIEQAGFAEWSRDEWLGHGSTLMRCASKIAEWCAAHQIPPRLLGPGDLQEAGPTPDAPQGITSHASVSQAWGRSDHWDPGPGYPFDILLEAVELFLS